jgi:aspartyl-tRNA(Asn)/glutamyl-tRNA(Gln) amidotransferase subunit C
MPAEFSRADVERIARLARLELTEHEKTLLTPQLGAFLAYADEVQQIVTTGVPPTSHPLASHGMWRDDAADACLERSEAIAEAPDGDAARGLFKVPRVLA